ncbi:MAG: tRNA (adenosine(37)-N6)-threonylcarbamoyltransferase complex ATPase subunit type 1 TsaE [Planctomycetales bacterium]|nr:tRNA (adenosine(37)-N6)-threonylcarbamoyltransferase complex ATPase subunit type 1 TsaE [Planctomycetales bacterium]
MSQFCFVAQSEDETDQLGQLLADVLPAGSVVALSGTLGAGKTRLVQAVAVALGSHPENITSPTFVLVNEYLDGRLPVYHFDAYRLRDEDEFLELGPEEYFEGSGITFVEWADRVAGCLPAEVYTIAIESLGVTEREFLVSANWEHGKAIVARLANSEKSQ